MRLYRITPRPPSLSLWAIDQPSLLLAAIAADAATAAPDAAWPRASLPEPAQSLMTDDQLLFILNTIEGARASGRVWTEEDIV